MQDFRRNTQSEAEIIPSLPGKIRKADGSYTDLLTALGITGTAVTHGNGKVSTIEIGGVEYNLSEVLEKIAGAIDMDVLTTRGDIIYRNATAAARLAKGTENQVLQMGANDPAWADPIYKILSTKPTTEAVQHEGLVVYSTDTDNLQFCKVKGEQELDTLTVTAGAITTPGAGNVTIQLNGVDKAVAVNGGTLDVHNATITAAATANGNITLTLDGTAVPVTVANLDTAAAVAGKVTAAMAANANWTVGNVDAVLTFTAKAVGVKSGAFTFSGGTTGVTCTAGITQTTPGVAADTATGVATKLRAASYTGWTTGGADAVVTFTKDAVGACSAPTFTDTDNTGAAGMFVRTNEGITDVWEGDGWKAWTPSLTWGTGAPATLTTVARYQVQNKTVTFNVYISSADGNDASSLTIALPIAPKDNNSFIAPHALQLIDTTWREAMAYIDDGASVIAFYNFGACTDSKAVKFIVSGQYEIA